MLKMSYAGFPGPYPAISAQFTLKMCVSAENCKKITKNLYFEGSTSFKVIDVDTNKKLVTIACYNKQHVCAYLQLFLRYTR